MADPEQIYQEVLQEEQGKGVSGPVAEGRAKAARARAENGSPHPKEPKWWPGAQPHLEGGDDAAPTSDTEEAPSVEETTTDPAPAQPEAAAQPAEEPQAAPPAPAEPAPQEPAQQPEPAAAPAEPAPAAAAVAAPQPAAAAAAPSTATELPPEQRPGGVTHGTTSGTRLRPEDEVTTDAQFEGQRAMYERRKLIDELVATGVPAVSASNAGRPRSGGLAVLYLLIPLLVVAFLVMRDDEETVAEPTNGNGGTETQAPPDGGGGDTIVAENISFTTGELSVPADEPADLVLDNQDTALHNVVVTDGEAPGEGENLFTSPDAQPGDQVDFTLDPLEAGEYLYFCEYHPTMTGTLTVD